MSSGDKRSATPHGDDVSLPFDESVGYQIRQTHRLIQRNLQHRILPHGISIGMWYFLRALWHEDGLIQNELSARVGTMEPTTLGAIKSMERLGLVERVRSTEDRRKIHVFLTERGRALELDLIPVAKTLGETAVAGFSARERETLLSLLRAIQDNLAIYPEIDDGHL